MAWVWRPDSLRQVEKEREAQEKEQEQRHLGIESAVEREARCCSGHLGR